MAVPGKKPQDFAVQTVSADDDRHPFIKDPTGTPLDSFITTLNYLLPTAFLAGRAGGQVLFGGTLTAQTLTLKNNAIDDLGLTIDGSGNVVVDTTLKTDTITEKTAANGVDIELFKIKDNTITNSSGDLIIDAGTADVVLDGVDIKMSTFATFKTSGLSINNIVRKSGAGVTIEGTLHAPGGDITLGAGTNVDEISTTVNGSSTDDQLPTAKAVFNAISVEDLWNRDVNNLVASIPGNNVVTVGDLGGFIGNVDSATDNFLEINKGTGTLTTTDINYDPGSPGSIGSTGLKTQTFKPTTDIFCPGLAMRTAISGQAPIIKLYEGSGTGGKLLFDSVTPISFPISGFNDVPFPARIKLIGAATYTWTYDNGGIVARLNELAGYPDGVNDTGSDYLFKVYTDAGEAFKINRATNVITAEQIALLGGIVQVNADGDISSSVTLPDGTLATTQAAADSTLKIATTEFVSNAIAAGSGVTHEFIPVPSDGDTVFTLSNTPVDPSSSILMVNGKGSIFGAGKDFTLSGTTLTWLDPAGLTLKTTDDVQIWYDITIAPPGTLDQLFTYYFAKAGSDTNDGKSIEKPFLTATKTASEIVLQSPSPTKQFRMEMVDGGRYTENVTLPTNTTLVGTGTIVGNITLAGTTNIEGVRIEGGIIMSSGICVVNVPKISAPSTPFLTQTGGILTIIADDISHGGSGLGLDSTGIGDLYFSSDRMLNSGTGTMIDVQSTGKTFFGIKRITQTSASGEAIKISNAADVSGRIDFVDASVGTALDISGSSSLTMKFGKLEGTLVDDATNTINISTEKNPTLNTIVTVTKSNVTGNAEVFTIPFELDGSNDNNITYVAATGIATIVSPGLYRIPINISLSGIGAGHTTGDVKILAGGDNPSVIEGDFLARASTAGNMTDSGSVTRQLDTGDTVSVTVQVTGGATSVDVNINSGFSIHAIRRDL